jgi:hypothetical protein
MKVHQMPLVPDRLPLDRPQPRPADAARPFAALADLVALRVNPRQQDARQKPRRERERPEDATEEDAPPAASPTRINLLT